MSLSRIYAIFLRQVYLFSHNWTRLFSIFAWIFVDVVLWAFITKYLNSVSGSGFNFISIFVGAIIMWNLFVRFQQGMIMPLLEDVWTYNFLNYFGSPLKISEYAIGLMSVSVLTSVAGFSLMAVIAGLIIGYNIFILGISLAVFLFVLFIFGLAVGLFACGIILRFGPSAEWMAWPIPAILSPLVGVFYPISVLPHTVQIISRILPPTYVFEGMRQVLATGTLSSSNLVWGLGLGFVYIIAAFSFFTYIYRLVIRNGLISRFSAEATEF